MPPTCVLGATHTSLTSELPVAGCLAGGAASQKAPPVLLEELRQCHEKSCARAALPEGRSGGGEKGKGSQVLPFLSSSESSTASAASIMEITLLEGKHSQRQLGA